MAAVVKAYGFNSSGPTAASVDSADGGSFKFGRDDVLISASSAPIPVPNPAPGTHFSSLKWIALYVASGGGATSLLNRKVNMSAGLPTGVKWWYIPLTAYTQNTLTTGTAVGNYPADSGSDAQTPASQNAIAWTAMTTSPVSYDSATVAATNTTANGKYVEMVIGVDSTCISGAGATSIGNCILTYDEQRMNRESCFDILDLSYAEERLQARRLRHLPVSMRRGGSMAGM